MAEKKKRGPYKQYQFRDSKDKVLPRTTHLSQQLNAGGGERAERSLPCNKPLFKHVKRRAIDPHYELPQPDLAPEPSTITSPHDDHFEMFTSDEEILDDPLVTADIHQSDAEICDEEILFDLVLDEPILQNNLEMHQEDVAVLCEDKMEEEEKEVEEVDVEVEDEDDEEEEVVEGNNLNFTIQEQIKLLMLLATKKRHNLTYSAAENIMKLAGILSSDSTSDSSPFLLSKNLMKRAIKFFSSSLSEHHICPNCQKYHGIVEKVFTCSACGSECDADHNRKKGNVFLYLSIKDQLKSLFECCLSDEDVVKINMREKINQYNYEDIFDGKKYSKSVPAGYLSFTFFVDGVQVATTSKNSAWPVLFVLNELPVHLRQRHVLMACLWLGVKKPDMNEYLKPFRDECIELASVGFNYKKNNISINQKVKALTCVSDSVARPLLRRSTQFNGRFGCGLCYHPGIRMRTGRGTCRSYSIAQQQYPLRTHEELVQHAKLAEETGRVQYGIKGMSVLATLPDFDMVQCLDLDLFHALVNAAKRFTALWFDKKFSQRPFSISSKIANVNLRLKSITPTADVSRTPRPLEDRSDWRGHEWYYWVIVYSVPCLKSILPAKYLNHWALLVKALALVMQNSVTKSDVAYADRYILQFVVAIDELYGKSNVTFSIHLLTHLKQSVENFGQPWTHSAFIFESFNSEIKNSVKSSNGAAIQILTNMQLNEAIRRLKDSLHEFMNEKQKNYLDSVTKVGNRLASSDIVVGPAHLLGKPKKCVLSPEALTALQRSSCVWRKNDFLIYDRCVLSGEVFHSTGYLKASKQNNSMALLESGQYFEIVSFVVSPNDCHVLGYFYETDRKKLCDVGLPHIQVLKTEHEGTLRAIHVSQIQSRLLSFCVDVGGDTFRVACVNVLKSEMLT
ncbi:AP-1 complex subunit mu-1 [Frankliniella fusca]|uniref:AP-1 complex subunit mu-1 n=1 Tax=Frankliniella fusca TaxID=407009 RepID=A0AAE1HET5_9NEOP|nr:AP-1 complex subunit mu-1 [Frankliniella fusca]KAK3920020.1 AP-1 complex subunit mu-1 [Frankliniella fusca]